MFARHMKDQSLRQQIMCVPMQILIRPYITRTYVTLGTDGFGRSDTRKELRHFFEVDRYYIVVAALYALVKDGSVSQQVTSQQQ